MTYIYLVFNINNNPLKSYVGKTTDVIKREYSHKKRFGNEIIFTVIDQINSIKSKDWKPLEIKWINHYVNLGYLLENKNKGGNGPDKHSYTTKRKIAQSKKGNKYNLGNKYSEISKSKITKSKIGKKYNITKTGKEHGNYGKIRDENWKLKQHLSKIGGTFSEETKIKISQNKLGKNIKPVTQFNKQNEFIKEWPSLKQASQELNIKSGDISCCCNGKQKSAGGFIWRYKGDFE